LIGSDDELQSHIEKLRDAVSITERQLNRLFGFQ